MNWRQWIYDTLRNDPEVAALVGTRIHAGNTLTSRPEGGRFIVVVFMPSNRPGPGRYLERVQVWAHDTNRSYVTIDRILRAAQNALETAASDEEFIGATWEGDSQDQFDDALQTFTRHALFRMAGAREEATA